MKVQARLPGAPFRVVFDGQSHNNIPAAPNGMPSQLMSGRSIPWANVAVNGASWTSLLATVGSRRVYEQATLHAGQTILVMTGGTQDILDGDTGAQVYADAVAYAEAARTAGYDYALASTIPDALNIDDDPDQAQARADHNGLILADAAEAFDGVIDFDTALPDVGDTTYWDVDFVHLKPAGAGVVAALYAPLLDAIVTP